MDKRLEDQMNGKLEALLRHATKIDTVEEVAAYSYDIIDNILGFTEGAFGIVEDGYLKFIYARTVSLKQLQQMPLNGRGITIRAIKTGESQLVSDVRLDPDFIKFVEPSDIYSELDVPVKVGGKVVALINLEKSCLDAFSDNDRRIVEIVAEQVASAISRIEQLRAIKASEEKYRSLIDSSGEAILVISGTKIRYINQNAIKLLGYSEIQELIGQDSNLFLEKNHELSINEMVVSWHRDDLQPVEYMVKFRRKDGEIVEIEATVNQIDYAGSKALIVFARDISERKRFQTKLVQLHGSSKRLAVASTRDEIWDATIEIVSQLLGFDFAGIGILEEKTIKYVRTVGDEIPENWIIDLTKPSVTSRAIETGIPQLIRDTSLDPDYIYASGSTKRSSELAIPIIIEGKPVAILNIEEGKPSSFTEADMSLIQILVGQVSSALSRIFRYEEEINNIEIHNQELLEGMERIAGMVRHDLRGPLQTIKSTSYLIRRRPEQTEDLTRKIDESLEYAVKILDDLKTMTKPDVLNLTLTNLSDLVEKSIDSTNIPATIIVDKHLIPLNLEIDQYRIRRVIDNLVKNAVEAMPNGGILTLNVDAEDGMALMSVSDTGCGIKDDIARNLFTPLFTTKPSGIGLGLAICRQVVMAHGGSITFKSRVGEGTIFRVALPLKQRALRR